MTAITPSPRLANQAFRPFSSILIVVAVLAVWRLVLALFLPYDQLVSLFDDDAFYYFGVARNIAGGNGSTFDGIDLTNGYHPAWLALIVPVFYLFQGRAALIGVVVLSCLLFLAFGVMLARISRLVDNPASVLIAASPILALSVVGPSYFFGGMETGLAILAMTAVGLFVLRTDGLSPESATFPNATVLGVTMTIAIAARLDSVITLTALGMVLLYRWRTRLRAVVAAAVLPLAFLAVYMLVNLSVFGTLLPVSGQAKAAGGGPNLHVLVQFFSAPRVFGFELYLGLIAAPITAAALVIAARTRGLHNFASSMFGATVYLGALVTVIYYGLTSSWQLWPWYFYGISLSLLFCLIVVAGVLRHDRLLAAVCVLTVFTMASVWTVDKTMSAADRGSFVSRAPEVAEVVDRIAPAGSPIAVGDRAGSFGYHMHRPMVHLEGLVNSAEYLDALNSGTVHAFLRDRDVALYARVDAADGEPVDGTSGLRRFTEPQQGRGPKTEIYVKDSDLLLTFPLPDGTSYRVWRYRSELNPD